MRFDFRKLRRLPLGETLKLSDLVSHMTRRERRRFSRFFKCVLVKFAKLREANFSIISGSRYRGGYRYTISLSVDFSGWFSRQCLFHELRHAEQSIFSVFGMTKEAVYTKSMDKVYYNHLPAEVDAREHEKLSTWFKRDSKIS